MFRSRLINALIGCVVGLTFLVVGEPNRGSFRWRWQSRSCSRLTSPRADDVRQAPITAAIVIAGAYRSIRDGRYGERARV